MFNKKEDNNQVKSSTNNTTLPNLEGLKAHLKEKSDVGSTTTPVYLISEGTTVIGDIISDHGIRISGKVKGTVKSNGKCIIASSAEVEGDINALDADISGYVNGELVITNKLILRDTARIIGKVSTTILNMEDGSKLSGTCDMKIDDIKKPQSKVSNDSNAIPKTT